MRGDVGGSFLIALAYLSPCNMQGILAEYTSKVADIRIAIAANFRL
jgi:hypothetical protein